MDKHLCLFFRNDFPAVIPVPLGLTQNEILHCAHPSSLPIQWSQGSSSCTFHYKSQHICEVCLNWNMRFCISALKARRLVNKMIAVNPKTKVPDRIFFHFHSQFNQPMYQVTQQPWLYLNCSLFTLIVTFPFILSYDGMRKP